VVAHIDAVQTKPIRTINGGKIDARGETRGLAEHHIAFACLRIPTGYAVIRSDDKIIEAIAIHVAGSRR
jgi:hypothetical protein